MRRSAIALAKRAARAAPAQPLRASSSPLALPRPTSTSRAASPLLRRFGSTLPPRSQAFATATKEHVEHLKSLLSSPNGVMSTLDGSATADDLQPFNDDWMNKYHGKSQIVVKPKTTQEVSEILKYCNEQGLAVVPQGGNTGLVGESLCETLTWTPLTRCSSQVALTRYTMRSSSTSETWLQSGHSTRYLVSCNATPEPFSKMSTTIWRKRDSSFLSI